MIVIIDVVDYRKQTDATVVLPNEINTKFDLDKRS